MSSLLYAIHDPELEALFDLSLEELLNVEVTTASQEKESLLETPAIVSVITAHQIKDWGVQNVYEALSFLPGIVINETYMGYSVVTFRGVIPGLFNNKALFMINGHPSYERLFGSGHIEFIPMEIIERIEVVRSPASSLYGTNAVSGVVNIITKQGVEHSNEVTARAGSNDHYYSNFNLHDTHFTLSGSVQKDNGYDYGGTLDEFGNPVSLDYQNDLANVFLDVYGKDWSVNAAYYKQEDGRFGFNPWNHLNGTNENESFYLDLNKNFIIDDGQFNVWLRYDYADKEYDAGEFPFPSGTTGTPVAGRTLSTKTTLFNTTQRYSTELQYKKKVSDNFSYIIGATGEYDESTSLDFKYDIDGSRNPFGGFQNSPHTKTYAGYGQIKYRFNEQWVGIAGLRGEENDIVGFSGIVPRLGLTYEPIKNTYIKALYSEAFRVPVFLEQYVYVPHFTYGNIDLNREEVKTYELAVDSALNRTNQLQVSLYYLELRDEITRRPCINIPDFPCENDPQATQYFNAPGRNMYGIEAELKSILTQNLEMMLNASYSDGEDKTIEHLQDGFNGDAPFVTNYTFNAVFTYHLNAQWSGTLSDQFVSSKDYILQNGDTGSIDNYNLTNLVLTYAKHPFEGSLSMKNIFDEDYTYPEPVRRNLEEIPGGPGTTAYLTLRYYF